MSEDQRGRLTRLFKALTHPTRIAILDVLRNGEECVCEIEAQLGFRQAHVSQHLAALRRAGLVGDRRTGWNVYYVVIRPEVYTLIDASRAMLSLENHQYTAHRAIRSCRRCATSTNGS